jgi:hypothetical protein
MSETDGTPNIPTAVPSASETTQEAYSFTCTGCWHGWEQSYRVCRRTNDSGITSITYYIGIQRVLSPLAGLVCPRCGGREARITSSGQVSSSLGTAETEQSPPSGPRHSPVADNQPHGPVTRRGEAQDTDLAVHTHRGTSHHWLVELWGFFRIHRRVRPDSRRSGARRDGERGDPPPAI